MPSKAASREQAGRCIESALHLLALEKQHSTTNLPLFEPKNIPLQPGLFVQLHAGERGGRALPE